MSKATKKMLVPDLRFPEFRDAGEWEEKELSQACKVNPTAKDLPETFVYIDLESVEEGKLLKKNIISREGSPSRAQRLLKSGDIIFQMVRPYQKNNYYFEPDDEFDYVASTGYAQLRAYESKKYLYQYLHNDIFVGRVLEKCTGSNYPAINSNALSSILVETPEKKEQQKIADCLSSIDTLITLQSQKLDALKAHKKALMQQLFPANGETIPKLRFPEFRDAGEWVENTLEQVVNYENGKAHEQDIDDQGKYIVANSKFVSTEGEVKKFSNAANLLAKKNDILMVLSDVPNGRAIAKCFYVDKDNTYTVNQRICRFTAKENTVSLMLLYILDRNAYFLTFDDGVKQTNLKKDDVLNCPVFLPGGKEEQQKIADCLFSIDALVTAQTEKIDALKAHKKGLMQQLFPSPDEIGA